MNVGPVLEKKLDDADVALTHRQGQVLGRGRESVVKENANQAMEPPVNGDAQRRAADVFVLIPGRLSCLEPSFGLEKPSFSAKAAEIQSGIRTGFDLRHRAHR